MYPFGGPLQINISFKADHTASSSLLEMYIPDQRTDNSHKSANVGIANTYSYSWNLTISLLSLWSKRYNYHKLSKLCFLVSACPLHRIPLAPFWSARQIKLLWRRFLLPYSVCKLLVGCLPYMQVSDHTYPGTSHVVWCHLRYVKNLLHCSLDYQCAHSNVLLTTQLMRDIVTSYSILNISAKCTEKLTVYRIVNIGTELYMYNEKINKL